MLEVNEGGSTSSLTNGRDGFLFVVGPMLSDDDETDNSEVVQEFFDKLTMLNHNLNPACSRNISFLSGIVTAFEGVAPNAIPAEEVSTEFNKRFAVIEYYYRSKLLPVS